MKRIILAGLILIFIAAGAAYAGGRNHTCLWVWNVDLAGSSADDTDRVYCDRDGDGRYTDMGATYTEYAGGADTVTITWDTTNANVAISTLITLKSGATDKTLCTNTSALDLRVLAGADTAQLSTGGVYYHSETALADGDSNTFTLTAPQYFRLQMGENSAGVSCGIVWTTVHWDG